ncbi:MAG: PIN domain-containing protein [Caldithrix sp.]|nr:PIN domain-containing protein [Caldithrix sp.]
MILVDTSVWIDHLHKTNLHLNRLLEEGLVYIHPFIIGELACGNIKNRDEIIKLLQNLPEVKTTDHDEIIYFIEKHKLHGKGLGYIAIHLLASCKIGNTKLYTHDKKLITIAKELNVV